LNKNQSAAQQNLWKISLVRLLFCLRWITFLLEREFKLSNIYPSHIRVVSSNYSFFYGYYRTALKKKKEPHLSELLLRHCSNDWVYIIFAFRNFISAGSIVFIAGRISRGVLVIMNKEI